METAAERRRRRLSWYRLGVHGIDCVVVEPRPPEAYVCPICLDFFTEKDLVSGELTDEHVPPKAVDGEPLVLTCRTCNNAAGSLLDEAVTDEERLRTWGKPYAIGQLPGSVTFEGIRNNGSIRWDGETFVMLADPGQNNAETLAAHEESMTRFTSGASLELRFQVKGSPKRAGIGWMRAAYLGAFATYGYRYVLQPAFEVLRKAIAAPDSASFEPVFLQAPDEGALDPLIVEVTAPAFLVGCRAVVFGPRLILLPPWMAPDDWFATLRDRLTAEAAEIITLVSVIGRRWPLYPMYLQDG